ncbi:MAG: (2Fe-2S) ferredoxin domain-containing protein [Oscillatoriales cyanobacterium SM2_1_8]|nr:(2Fe-2S) ferredoxin domain-containing protein [Oscillatoriales cyanobacterium SM2_1_8]
MLKPLPANAPKSWQILTAPFLGFALDREFKLKYLRLQSTDGEFTVKLPKHLRGEAVRVLTAPVSLRLWLEPRGDCPQFKVQRFEVLTETVAPPPLPQSPSHKPSALLSDAPSEAPALPMPVLAVCNRGSCRKRGSEALCQALQSAIEEWNAGDRLELRTTGCLKGCKEGPTIELPDGTRKTGCRPGDARVLIAGILDSEA